MTLGRTVLKAAPYSLYATGAPWSGLSGVPGDLADGDDDTTYSAGTGLTLAASQFSVSTPFQLPQTCGNGQIAEWNGSAWACGDDDVGTDGGGGDITAVYASTGLSGGGSSGDVTLSADTGYLQRRVGGTCSSGNAIRVIGADGSVTCESLAGSSDHDHLGQTWTGSDNPLIIGGSFGSSSAALVLANTHQWGDGLRVESAGNDGLRVESAGDDGVYVVSAGDDGVSVESAGENGVHVGSAGNNGVHVYSAEGDGVYVRSAEGDGVYVVSAVYDGLRVASAGGDGVGVWSAGNSGLSVEYAGGNGLRVNGAGINGAEIWDTAFDGVQINNAGRDGVRADATEIGVRADTQDASHEWGVYTPDKIYGSNVTSAGPLTFVAQNGDVRELEPGDVVAGIGLAAPFADGPDPVPLVGRADGTSGTGVIGVVLSRFVAQKEIETENGAERLTRFRTHSAEGPVAPGEHLLIVVLGVTQVKVDPGTQIEPGQRLTASDVGSVRALRTETLNGMVVTEGAPVVGVALAAPEPGQETIPVFLSLR